MRKISGKNKPNTTEIMFCTTVNNGEMLGDISNIKVVLLLQHMRGTYFYLISMLFLMNVNVIYLRMSSDLAGVKNIPTSSLVLDYS